MRKRVIDFKSSEKHLFEISTIEMEMHSGRKIWTVEAVDLFDNQSVPIIEFSNKWDALRHARDLEVMYSGPDIIEAYTIVTLDQDHFSNHFVKTLLNEGNPEDGVYGINCLDGATYTSHETTSAMPDVVSTVTRNYSDKYSWELSQIRYRLKKFGATKFKLERKDGK